GVFAAFATVLTVSLTLECAPVNARGKVSGLIWAGGAIGIVLSGLIAPFILTAGEAAGWRIVWIGMGIVGIIAAAGFSLTRRSSSFPPTYAAPAQKRSQERKGLWATLYPLFQPRRLLFLTLVYCSFGCGYIIYFTFFIALLEQQGVSVLNAGFVWAAIGIAGAISGWVWGRVMDRWPTGFVLALALALGAIGSLSVLLHSQGWEYVGAALVGLTVFIAPPLMVTALVKRAVTDEEYTASFSMLTAFFALGQIVGPLASSWIVERSGLVVGTASSALVLGISAACAWGYGVMQRHVPVSSLQSPTEGR
ncbi:MAG TPA: YbfB/YjiJ family MFS transporter, partial [Ktedonobacteraceae bacterium]|nr:YbfB/YjiJ family MFS transporter [Ktedonobacteraceae bacterium]